MGLSGSRLRLHILLAFVNLSILATVWVVVDPAEALDRLSLVSAYLFLLLISFVLLVGPVRAVRTGRVTINHTLRRDVAIWSASSVSSSDYCSWYCWRYQITGR